MAESTNNEERQLHKRATEQQGRSTASESPSSSSTSASSSSSSDSSPLKSGIKAAVDATNTMLASLQRTTDQFKRPIVNGWHTVEQEGSVVANKALIAYERRHEYGPHIVVGSALATGGITAVRRGSKLAGAVTGGLFGGLAYMAVYETIDVDKIPDLLFGNDNDNKK